VLAELQEKTSFAIETTLSGKYVAKIIEKLKNEGYGIEMIYILVETPLLSIERIKVRVQSGGHYVSDDNVLRRFSRSKINFLPEVSSVKNRETESSLTR